MKTAILTCVNDRPNISPLIFECFKRLRLYYDVSLIVGYTSPEDEMMCGDWAFQDSAVHIVGPIENRTGKKFNEVLRYALGSASLFEAFMIMGDDDSISSDGFEDLQDACIHSGAEYWGFNENAYVDCREGKAMMHKYSHPNKLIGAGRMITRRALEDVVYKQTIVFSKDYDDGQTITKKGERRDVNKRIADYMVGYGYAKPLGELKYEGLWPDRAKCSLDHASELKLVMHGVTPYAIPFDGRIHITDFKTVATVGGKQQNLWPYSILERKCTSISFDEATWFMNSAELEIINVLRK